MASIIPGYEYDIFISYRQKDNKYDGWVTEFVNNLRKELEATFKEEISIYFDENPSDGILETYDVDKSLEGKLKSLIFIPIISQTYCDPKSFAWQNEFIAFNRSAENDSIGSRVKLSNGNITGRILPVKIHDLDTADKTLLEKELGGIFRSIDFIFKSPGVNRPLKPDDSRTENLNHTYYRDQINKVANAVKEIITALKYTDGGQNDLVVQKLDPKSNSWYKGPKKATFKIAIWSFIILVLAVSSYLLLPLLSKTSIDNADKSIAVLPFENLSNDPDQDYIGSSSMEEILNDLFKIGGLQIPSSTSSRRYKNSKLSAKEIAGKLNVSYILEGSVSVSGNKIRIIVSLVRARDERRLWSNDYDRDRTATNLHEIYSNIAQQVAEKMNVAINPETKRRIEARPTENTEAYTLFLQANENMKSVTFPETEKLPFDKARFMLERAISLDSGFADAYALLATWWIYRAEIEESIVREEVLKEAEPLLAKALSLDKNSYLAHSSFATIKLWYYWDFQTVEKETKTINELAPSISSFYSSRIDYLLASGQSHEAFAIAQKSFKADKAFSFNWIQMATALYFNNQQDSAVNTMETALRLFPDDIIVLIFSLKIFVLSSRYSEAISLFEKDTIAKLTNGPFIQSYMGIAYLNTGNKHKSHTFLKELLAKCNQSSFQSPAYFCAALYTAMGEKAKAFTLLEKAYTDRNLEMYWIKVDPLFKPLHGDPRFENILKKIGFN